MIPRISEEKLYQILSHGLTPSAEIKDRERLFGRESEMRQIKRAFNSDGRIVFIYGDRGVGKSSLSITSAKDYLKSHGTPIVAKCGKSTTFGDIISEIYIQGSDQDRFEKEINSVTANFLGTGFGAELANSSHSSDFEQLNTAIAAIRKIANDRSRRTVIIIDEFERLSGNPTQLSRFAEFFKNFPDEIDGLKLIVCGIASSIKEMMGVHQSSSRRFENLYLRSLYHDDLWKIVTDVADQLDVKIPREALIRISQISDGFPHYTHLIGETLFWAMHDDPKQAETCSARHFDQAIGEALRRSNEEHQDKYRQATQKSKLTKEYELALWCLADHNDRERQISDIYGTSYKRLSTQIEEKNYPKVDKSRLNQRLLKLRDDLHGNMVLGQGAGWFAFRENIMRGYVRLRAEKIGIRLASDHHIGERN